MLSPPPFLQVAWVSEKSEGVTCYGMEHNPIVCNKVRQEKEKNTALKRRPQKILITSLACL
jgi:hypothetical protein